MLRAAHSRSTLPEAKNHESVFIESKPNNLLFLFSLTVLAVASREAAEADALVRVQQRGAAAAVVARLLGAGVALVGGHVAGAQDVLLSEDGRSHQGHLGQSGAGGC